MAHEETRKSKVVITLEKDTHIKKTYCFEGSHGGTQLLKEKKRLLLKKSTPTTAKDDKLKGSSLQ